MKKSIIFVLVVLVIGISSWWYLNSAKVAETDMNMEMNEMEAMEAMESAPSVPSQEVSSENISGVKEFTVTGQNFSFAPKVINVKKGDRVKIHFKNAGGFHDLKIDEFNVATKKIGDGAEETIEFIADKAGMFEYYCSVGSHRAMGMKGTLIVE